MSSIVALRQSRFRFTFMEKSYSFNLFHNIPDPEPVLQDCILRWSMLTKEISEESFALFINNTHKGFICLSMKEMEEVLDLMEKEGNDVSEQRKAIVYE